MSKNCPYGGIALYIDCLECSDKLCKKMKYDTICIGIDQSYQRTGISICADGNLIKVKSVDLSKYNNKSDKRRKITEVMHKILQSAIKASDNVVCVIERIRLRSEGFININYIKSIGALNATIADVCSIYSIKIYSVDTRCWKSTVVGTSKRQANKFGVPDEKWPTIKWAISKGFEKQLMIQIEGRKEKGTFTRNGKKYMYNNDAADSAAIATFWFVGDRQKLKEET